MANNRNATSNSTGTRSGVPLKPTLARAPNTPRPPQDATNTTSTPPFRPKLQESDFRPKLNNHKPTPSPLSHTRPTAQVASTHTTPQALAGKARTAYIISSTPTSQTPSNNTPSHAQKRPLVISPTNTEPAVRRPQLTASNRAKSVVGPARPTAANVSRPPAVTTRTAPTVRGFVKTPDSARSNASTLQPHVSAPQRVSPLPTSRPTSVKLDKDSSSMFFHASDAKTQSQPAAPVQPPRLRKTPSFLYANGQHAASESRPPSHASSSPVLSNVSAVTDLRSPQLFVQSPAPSDSALTPNIVSPPLSAVSSASNYFTTPISPPKNNIHLSYRKGASQIFALGGPPLPFQPAQPTQRKTSNASMRSSHLRSTSLSSIDMGTPDRNRRQSHPIPAITEPLDENASLDSPTPLTESGHDGSVDAPPSDDSPEDDVLSVDPYAEARRERKVLDLEISNSSLLAINKSLERELRKQKAELKRFRRLSRAGQFAVPRRPSGAEGDLSLLDEEDDLPDFDDDDGGARPSSPFHSVPETDTSDEESTSSSALPLSPGAQADRDAAQRADDEKRLRLDLSRHRELLLDTQRMNQSLQRCLYRTEGLIKDGRKALDYQVASSEVQLGGRILDGDDVDDASSQADDAESIHSIDERPGALPDFGEPDRRSVGSEMDSGIDLMGKRGTLTMARDNPNFSRPTI
ncbi:hypothetical protein AUEXF2481DRAFT_5444 [Aureobasidium subglaciale EXF-2481]|uniref:Uncharacterized protein n=1 Tax=Aureobasidium subglaciale (strain EXF-2481) TaxID=1043005 RepID=A0A074YBP7_AURSE|nr:uncharacterized protein AUEXF2481DRAFT_5444 [Aureobasidium subglaciale EXF-2481]KAI5196831.1 hypothetical protein E4T38_08308 [Aureobasidium subglaciale]KAI5215576.1 hypothetical protein E4T40_08289 [Aureobasidium subglaciale]KAI5218817.1 hypothetical protein E4T41_08204 [Aureobasidium subglaciale]KAI5256462.1 hypothetical protein E4T46_08180 [Aureobasidium subglaciale]KEQ95208.1 hypothetical protein AUEXF2481DRAFT_5444 [Aureobasidium subglaciale EXF-2481]